MEIGASELVIGIAPPDMPPPLGIMIGVTGTMPVGLLVVEIGDGALGAVARLPAVVTTVTGPEARSCERELQPTAAIRRALERHRRLASREQQHMSWNDSDQTQGEH